MSKKIFVINGHEHWEYSPGTLAKSVIETIEKTTKDMGYEVQVTNINDKTYQPADEVAKIMWADIVIYHTPLYWFNIPALFKRYIDDVYMAGNSHMFTNDGREGAGQDEKYGTGGLCQGKKYMLSVN